MAVFCLPLLQHVTVSPYIPHHIMYCLANLINSGASLCEICFYIEMFAQVVSARESVVKIDEAAANMETTVILESDTAVSDLDSQQL